MSGGHRRTYVIVFGAATVIGASIFLYRLRPLAGITFGSTAVALAVLAHLGVLAAIVGPLVARRRSRRHPPSQQDRRKE
jgi:membrane protein implicated in regulation of membrane protease activity